VNIVIPSTVEHLGVMQLQIVCSPVQAEKMSVQRVHIAFHTHLAMKSSLSCVVTVLRTRLHVNGLARQAVAANVHLASHASHTLHASLLYRLSHLLILILYRLSRLLILRLSTPLTHTTVAFLLSTHQPLAWINARQVPTQSVLLTNNVLEVLLVQQEIHISVGRVWMTPQRSAIILVLLVGVTSVQMV